MSVKDNGKFEIQNLNWFWMFLDNLEVQEHESIVVDDPELMSGKHRTVLNLPSFIVSFLWSAFVL